MRFFIHHYRKMSFGVLAGVGIMLMLGNWYSTFGAWYFEVRQRMGLTEVIYARTSWPSRATSPDYRDNYPGLLLERMGDAWLTRRLNDHGCLVIRDARVDTLTLLIDDADDQWDARELLLNVKGVKHLYWLGFPPDKASRELITKLGLESFHYVFDKAYQTDSEYVVICPAVPEVVIQDHYDHREPLVARLRWWQTSEAAIHLYLGSGTQKLDFEVAYFHAKLYRLNGEVHPDFEVETYSDMRRSMRVIGATLPQKEPNHEVIRYQGDWGELSGKDSTGSFLRRDEK